MANLSKVMLPDGNTYDFIDTNLRNFGSEEPIVIGHDGKGGTVYRIKRRIQIDLDYNDLGQSSKSKSLGIYMSDINNKMASILNIYGSVKIFDAFSTNKAIASFNGVHTLSFGYNAHDDVMKSISYNVDADFESTNLVIYAFITADEDEEIYDLHDRSVVFDVIVDYLIYSDSDTDLDIVLQPSNRNAKSGYVYFKVFARNAASYQWQASTNGGSTWSNSGMSGNKTSVLSVQATSGRNGYMFRCNITDENGETVASEPATFTYA